MSDIDKLKGLIIKKVFIDPSKESLKIETDKETLFFSVSAGCCSDTWIEHIHLESWAPDPIDKTEDKFMEALMPTKQSVDKVYASYAYAGTELVLGIEYRNSSNGYYGGDLEISPNEPASEWKLVEESF